MVINHNLSAMYANRHLKFKNWEVDSNMAKLASGMRINRAADDASGLAVSEKMRAQIRGLARAGKNGEDGIAFIQVAEGYLAESTQVLQRIRELAIQSSNGIYSAEDRMQIAVEVSQLVDEVDRIASHAEFNRFNMLTGKFANPAAGGNPTNSIWFHIGANMDQRIRAYIGTMTAAGLGIRTAGAQVSISSPDESNKTIGTIDAALLKVTRQRADLGAYQNRMENVVRGVAVAAENTQAAESRIRDTDMAEEMVDYVKNQILVRSGTAMLAQANLLPQSVLELLR
jgi:flagellin